MKKIILILLAFVAFYANSQELVNDTIEFGDRQIILSIPNIPTKIVSEDGTGGHYTEGFFRAYALSLERTPELPYVMVHCGGLATFDMPEPESVVYNCKLGNLASSIYYKSKGKYFRRDKYPNGISVSFLNVPEEKLELANRILDNLTVRDISR